MRLSVVPTLWTLRLLRIRISRTKVKKIKPISYLGTGVPKPKVAKPASQPWLIE